MLMLMENGVTKSQRSQRPKYTQAENYRSWIALEQKNVAHKRQIVIHRIGVNKNAQEMRHLSNKVRSPKNRREVRPSRNDNAPKMHDVTEKNSKGGKQEAQAHAKEHQ